MSREPVSLAVDANPRISIASRSGRVTVVAEERADILVLDGSAVAEIVRDEGGQLSISSRHGSASLELRCPRGSDVRVGTISGRVELRGSYGEVHVTTTSGNIELDEAEAIDARTVSGSISVGRCARKCRLSTKSGKAEIRQAENADVATVSGKVSVDASSGAVNVKTASGKVEIGASGQNNVAVQTLSGSVTVTVPRGTRPTALLRSLAGKGRCDCEEGNDCRVAVSTMSGKIEVVPG
jgi:DUF4097 and DUF4098 domain-containing protein YvlB